jgi:fatty-acid desaturase
MKNFGHNFWLIFLPFHILGAIGLYFAPSYILTLFLFWFFIGVIGNGVAAHRYFAHGQFETHIIIHWVLGILSTLAAIGPLTYWIIQHKVHHARSDKVNDPHSPVYNNWFHVFYSWTFPQGNNQEEYLKERFAKRLTIEMMRDPFYIFFHKYHYHIIFSFCVLLLLINPVLLTIYCLAYCIDFFRLGAINYWCHRSGYRNHDTNDATTNNLLLGWLGMGFGWHNNHHASPGKLVLQERWWEIDVEGYIGRLLSK